MDTDIHEHCDPAFELCEECSGEFVPDDLDSEGCCAEHRYNRDNAEGIDE